MFYVLKTEMVLYFFVYLLQCPTQWKDRIGIGVGYKRTEKIGSFFFSDRTQALEHYKNKLESPGIHLQLCL